MKAVVYYGAGDVRLEDYPEPIRTDDNAVAKVECCAICGTDLKIWKFGNPRCLPPRIIGHEVACTLVHVGKDVEGFSVGDRITLATTVGCGECELCQSQLSNLCNAAQPISNASDGAFAEFITIPPLALKNGNVIKIPENIPSEWAALCEPLSCAINAQSHAVLKPGATVLIIGGGPLGALHAELAKAKGASKVMISEISEKRLELLSGLSNVSLINSSKEDTKERVMQETDNKGVDLVIICAPSNEAHEKSLEYAKKGGYVCLFASLPVERASIQWNSRTIHYNELKVYGVSDSRPEHVQEALRLMSTGAIDVEKLITHRFHIDDFFVGLKLMEAGESLKVLIFPEIDKV